MRFAPRTTARAELTRASPIRILTPVSTHLGFCTRFLRISERCALDGEDLDFAGRRAYVPRLPKDRDAQLVRVQGIKTEAAERVVPMLPALYDLLIDHKAEFGWRSRPCLREPQHRRAMYLIGHTNPTRTMRVYQQVIDMGEGGLQTLEKLIGCTLDEAFALLSGRGVLATNWQPANKNASQPGPWSELEGTETP
jgi:hypothetical protein